MRKIVVALALVLFPGCRSMMPKTESCGVPQASRCSADLVELCSPKGRWVTVMDCTKLGPTWQCFPTTDGPACLEAPHAEP